MNKVHLVGDIGDKFGHEWNMNVSDYVCVYVVYIYV